MRAVGIHTLTPVTALAEREERFSAFVFSHRERARRLAWRLIGGDEAAAEDVTQDALVKAYQALTSFREDSTLATWFYRILVRQAQTYRRWRAVRNFWHRELGESENCIPEEKFGEPTLRRRITQALDRLSRRQREAFILVHLEGFTVQECADLLGKPVGTVKSHLHRALVILRHELADFQELVGGE